LVAEREKKPRTVVMCDPLFVCWSQFAPVMQLTPAGFKFLRGIRIGDRWYVMPLEWPDMAVLEMFRANMPLWQDMPAEVTSDAFVPALAAEDANATLLHQEVIYRSLCASMRSALLYGGGFSCPFAPHGCAPGSAPCSELTRPDSISEDHCLVRAYLTQDHIDPACVAWDNTSR
jgi:hypothetical protein